MKLPTILTWMGSVVRFLIPACAAVLFAACSGYAEDGGDSGGACIEDLSVDCTPLHEPTFDKLFDVTIKNSCSVGGNSCHTASGAKGGLIMETADGAYDALVNSANPRVLAGDPGCSLLMKRLEAPEPSKIMPPGNQLSPEARCAIIQWISQGAKR